MNAPPSRVLVMGIGSPNGDDQAGWRVIDQLNTRVATVCQLRRAKVPHELLDCIAEVDVCHLVDACAAGESDVEVKRFELIADNDQPQDFDASLADEQRNTVARLPELRCDTTHHVDLATVLRLAHQLDQLPRQVILWTIPARHFAPSAELSSVCQTHIHQCAKRIEQELSALQLRTRPN